METEMFFTTMYMFKMKKRKPLHYYENVSTSHDTFCPKVILKWVKIDFHEL